MHQLRNDGIDSIAKANRSRSIYRLFPTILILIGDCDRRGHYNSINLSPTFHQLKPWITIDYSIQNLKPLKLLTWNLHKPSTSFYTFSTFFNEKDLHFSFHRSGSRADPVAALPAAGAAAEALRRAEARCEPWREMTQTPQGRGTPQGTPPRKDSEIRNSLRNSLRNSRGLLKKLLKKGLLKKIRRDWQIPFGFFELMELMEFSVQNALPLDLVDFCWVRILCQVGIDWPD